MKRILKLTYYPLIPKIERRYYKVIKDKRDAYELEFEGEGYKLGHVFKNEINNVDYFGDIVYINGNSNKEKILEYEKKLIKSNDQERIKNERLNSLFDEDYKLKVEKINNVFGYARGKEIDKEWVNIVSEKRKPR